MVFNFNKFLTITTIFLINCNEQLKSVESNHPFEKPYEPIPVEERWFTNTLDKNNLRLEKRYHAHKMILSHHDFQRNCDGQCFFHKGDKKDDHLCDPQEYECKLIASFTRHADGSHHCQFIGTGLGGFYNHSICLADAEKGNQFYTISLIRSFANYSCHQGPWNFEWKMPCVPNEFVAINFVNTKGSTKTGEDLWYTCVAGEKFVTYWSHKGNKIEHLKRTYPFLNQAPGVILSRMEIDPETKSFNCQFLISSAYMGYEQLDKDKIITPVQFPLNENSIMEGETRIKIAQGRVLRDTSGQVGDEGFFEEQQSIINPDFDGKEPNSEYLVVDNFTGVKGMENIIDFEKLKIITKDTHIKADDKDNPRSRIIAFSDRCTSMDQNVRKSLRCYFPNRQKSCLFRHRCPILIMVEEVPDPSNSNEKVFQFRMASYRLMDIYHKKVVRPGGYVAMAFSNDTKMGEDLVISCQFFGTTKMQLVVSWNEMHSNEFNASYNQHLIFDKKITVGQYPRSDEVFCEWKMKFRFKVDISGYVRRRRIISDVKHSGLDKRREIPYDLKGNPEGYFLLTAAGHRVYDDQRITYHDDFRQTLSEKFFGTDVTHNRAICLGTELLNIILVFMQFLLLL